MRRSLPPRASRSSRKGRIRAAWVKAAPAVNAELVTLYLSIGRDILARRERQGWGAKVLEQMLVDHIQRFLLELGQGFAFVGRQVPLEVGRREFRLDLVFYHLELRRFVILSLKTGRFEPELVGCTASAESADKAKQDPVVAMEKGGVTTRDGEVSGGSVALTGRELEAWLGDQEDEPL